jgi:hypothetical protein
MARTAKTLPFFLLSLYHIPKMNLKEFRKAKGKR